MVCSREAEDAVEFLQEGSDTEEADETESGDKADPKAAA